MSAGADRIEAAGGVLWRRDTDGLRYAIIHRPKYDDWSLPKGKLDPGETHEQAAVREVEEETGWQAEVGPELGVITYEHGGRPKRVEYWSMRAIDGDFVPNKEVDDLRWLPQDQARALLSYDRDRDVFDRFVAALD
ncbi:MAG TPA: NUDIX hydrolase [Euzebyales bacterium]|nr:NUDIX hydrolase [Euzebyales bacterium]